MTSPILKVLHQVTQRIVENMHLPLVEKGTVVLQNGIKFIQLEESGVLIPFTMCEFNQNLQNYTVSYLPKGELQMQEMTIYNALKEHEQVALTPIDRGRKYLVHYKIVEGINDDDGL